MNVILIFPQQDRETGVFIKKAFKSLGCNVFTFDPKVEPVMDIAASVVGLCKDKSIDLIFMSRTAPLINVIQAVRDIPNRPLTTFWNVDCRKNIDHWINLFPMMRMCDFWFTTEYGNIKKYKDQELGNPHWLSQGIDPNIHCSPNATNGYQYDVSFLGAIDNFHEKACGRMSLLREIAGKFRLNTNHTYLKEASKVYGSSKINIGSNAFPDVRKYLSVRDYKICGAGGFLLTNHVDGIEEIYVPGIEIETYKSIGECINKIHYYLHHNKEREQIAYNGRIKTHEKYKYSDRIKDVLNMMEKYK